MGKLLNAAKREEPGNRVRNVIGREESELVLAWLHGEITSSQAAKALGIKTDYAHTMLSQWLVKAVRSGHLSVKMEGRR